VDPGAVKDRRVVTMSSGQADRDATLDRDAAVYDGAASAMPDAALLESFPTPAESPFIVEHVSDEFTSLCPKTGQPDFGSVTVRFEPKSAKAGGSCVELKSLKLYLQSFRNEGIFYEAVTNRIRDDLAKLMKPAWLLVRTDWKGRGGLRSTIRAEHGEVPDLWRS